ncbi:MAG: helix-turn-helix domain-containing protein [Phycisphaeraceae bacterium]
MSELSRTIRSRRHERGLTLAEAARRAALAKSYLSMIENDRPPHPPSAAALSRLEHALSLEPGTLVAIADWQRTPASVRGETVRLRETAERARTLAKWLGETASRRDGGGKSLDALYRSGALRKRIEKAIGPIDESTDAGVRDPLPMRGPQGGTGVPLINKVAAGYPADFTDLGYPARVADEYVPGPPGTSDPDAFAAYVDGESMLPDYRGGDIVVFSPAAVVSDGCDCFVRMEDSHETTFKRVYFEDEGRSIRLQPLNPKFAPRTLPREAVGGLYRAVWRMSPV